MENIVTQGIVEKLNGNLVQQADLNLQLANAKAELEKSEAMAEIKGIEIKLKELKKEDTELREEGKKVLMDNNIKKFEALDGTTIQLNKKPGALVIEDDADIEEYKKEKVTVTIDKKAIKEDLKEGVVIDGVYIKEDYNLVIKNK